MQMAIGENVGLETYAADPAAMLLQRGEVAHRPAGASRAHLDVRKWRVGVAKLAHNSRHDARFPKLLSSP